MSTLAFINQQLLEVLPMAIRKEKEIKWTQIAKEVKCHCLKMIWYFTQKTLKLLKELINEFGKVVRYKINLQRSVAFLYTTYKGQKEKLSKQSHLSLH